MKMRARHSVIYRNVKLLQQVYYECESIVHDFKETVLNELFSSCTLLSSNNWLVRSEILGIVGSNTGKCRLLQVYLDPGGSHYSFIVSSISKTNSCVKFKPKRLNELSDSDKHSCDNVLASLPKKLRQAQEMSAEVILYRVRPHEFLPRCSVVKGTIICSVQSSDSDENTVSGKPSLSTSTAMSRLAATMNFTTIGTKGNKSKNSTMALPALHHLSERVLFIIPTLFKKFYRPEEIDDLLHQHFLLETMANSPPIDHAEESMLSKSFRMSADLPEMKRVRGTATMDFSVWKSTVGDNFYFKVEGSINAPHTEVLSYLWHICSNERMEKHLNSHGDKPILFHEVKNSHSGVGHAAFTLPHPIKDRLVMSWCVWDKRIVDGVMTSVLSMCDLEEYMSGREADEAWLPESITSKFTRSRPRLLWTIQEVSPNISRAKLVAQIPPKISVPMSIIDFCLKSNDFAVGLLQSRFMNGEKEKEFCKESYAYKGNQLMMPNSPCHALNEEQARFVKKCETIVHEIADETKWDSKTIENSAFADITTKIPKKSTLAGWKNRSSLGVVSAKIDLDVPPAHFVARWFMFDARWEMRRARRVRCLARIIVEKLHENDCTFAQITPFPWPLLPREWVTRNVAAAADDGKFVIAFETITTKTEVDYGQQFKVVRGIANGFMEIHPHEEDPERCTLYLSQRLDAGGLIPVSVINHMLPKYIEWLENDREALNRDSEIDNARMMDLASNMKRGRQETYSNAEKDTLKRVEMTFIELQKISNLSTRPREVESPDLSISMSKFLDPDSGLVVWKCSTDIDAEPEVVAAYRFILDLREHRKIQFSHNGTFKQLYEPKNNHHAILYSLNGISVRAISRRLTLMRSIWKSDGDGNIVMAYETISDPEDEEYKKFPAGKGEVRTETSLLFKLRKKRNNPNMCHLDFQAKFNFGGYFPSSVMNRLSERRLRQISRWRRRFDRTDEIEAMARRETLEYIEISVQKYTEEEDEIFARASGLFEHFSDGRTVKTFEVESPDVRAHVASKETMVRESAGSALCRSSSLVRASATEIMSWCWNVESRYFFSSHLLNYTVLDDMSGHKLCTYAARAMPKPLDHRDFVNLSLWRKDAGGIYTFVTWDGDNIISPAIAKDARRIVLMGGQENTTRLLRRKELVRGSYRSIMTITPVDNSFCLVDYAVDIDFKLSSAGSYVIPRVLEPILLFPLKLRISFYSQRLVMDWDEEDGRCLGRIICTKSKRLTKDAKVRELFLRFVGLRELKQLHPFIEEFLCIVVRGNLAVAGETSARLGDLSQEDGKIIAGGFSGALLTNIGPQSAVEEWIVRYRAMSEMDRRYPWFRSMMNEIATQLLSSVSWGIKLRVTTGAAISLFDMFSDLLICLQYVRHEENASLGHAFFLSLLACFALQTLVVLIVKNGSLRGRGSFIDLLACIVGLKPILDAYRVASGKKRSKEDSIDPRVILVFTKNIELFCEAIPGAVIQAYVIQRELREGLDIPAFSIVSFLSSCLSAGFISASITYDFDCDPEYRRGLPSFYGFLRDDTRLRSLTFLAMTFNSSIFLFLRSLSYSLLLHTKSIYFFTTIAFEMGWYSIMKGLRKDYLYWVRFDSLYTSYIMSVLIRTIEKQIHDFTALLQFRHPSELGGIAWTINALFGILMPFMILGQQSDGETEEEVQREGYIWSIFLGAALSWLFTFLSIIALMKPPYRGSFFSTETCKNHNIKLFSSPEESRKKEIFEVNELLWKKEKIEELLKERKMARRCYALMGLIFMS